MFNNSFLLSVFYLHQVWSLCFCVLHVGSFPEICQCLCFQEGHGSCSSTQITQICALKTWLPKTSSKHRGWQSNAGSLSSVHDAPNYVSSVCANFFLTEEELIAQFPPKAFPQISNKTKQFLSHPASWHTAKCPCEQRILRGLHVIYASHFWFQLCHALGVKN